MAATAPYRVGAVVYHPKIEQIWPSFGERFAEQGFPLDVRYAGSYEEQIGALLGGQLDMAAASLAELEGARVGFDDADSPQAHILPVHALREQGFDPRQLFRATRLDRDLGKHGDTGGAELAQSARVRAGELDASVVSSVTLAGVDRLGDASELRIVSTSPRFHHRCLTRPPGPGAEVHARPNELLLPMGAADPKFCEPMELQYVNQWVGFDPDGYRQLVAAVAAGPVMVG